MFSLTVPQAIIQSILVSGRLGPNVELTRCYGLMLKHLKSEELHWLHPDLTVGEVEQRYESHHVEAEWRYRSEIRTFTADFLFQMKNYQYQSLVFDQLILLPTLLLFFSQV